MRKITQEAFNAWRKGRRLKRGNTETDGATLWLHGSPIAHEFDNGALVFSLCGYETVTTRERLKPIARCYQRQHEQYCKGIADFSVYRYYPATELYNIREGAQTAGESLDIGTIRAAIAERHDPRVLFGFGFGLAGQQSMSYGAPRWSNPEKHFPKRDWPGALRYLDDVIRNGQ